MLKKTLRFIVLSPFTNFDDPIPPNWFEAGKKMWVRKVLWWVRNPFHDLCFYIIGIADKSFTSIGKHPNHVFNPNYGWNWAVRKYKIFRFPFVSYINHIKFYIGWRERGNFGIKLTSNNGQ